MIDAVIAALRADLGPSEVERLSPFTGAYIRKLAREHGIPPAGPCRSGQAPDRWARTRLTPANAGAPLGPLLSISPRYCACCPPSSLIDALACNRLRFTRALVARTSREQRRRSIQQGYRVAYGR
jgi:hypothetical protein